MGRDDLHRFGLVALATDLTIEADARRLLPDNCRLHVTRIAFDNPTTAENLRATGPRLAAAAELLVPGISLAGIGFGCTSASAVLGDEVEAAFGGRAPVSTPMSAALRAFATLRVGRVALMTPYIPATTDLVGDYLAGHGLQVVARHSMGYHDDRDMALLPAPKLIDFVKQSDHPEAEALFLSCTALPAVPLIAQLEDMLGKPVISANLALFWAMLDLAGISAAGPGHLFGTRG